LSNTVALIVEINHIKAFIIFTNNNKRNIVLQTFINRYFYVDTKFVFLREVQTTRQNIVIFHYEVAFFGFGAPPVNIDIRSFSVLSQGSSKPM
jgi:hypothetical protein